MAGSRYKIEFGVAGIEKTVQGINKVRSASQARAAAAEARRKYANLDLQERIEAEKALPVKQQLANLEKERARNKNRLAEAERKLQERERRGLKSPAMDHRVAALRLANKEIDRHIAKLRQANTESRKGGGIGGFLGGKLRGAVGAAGAYFGFRAGRQTLADVGELQRQASTIGVSTDLLQEFQFGASQNSITGRQAALGLQRFARRSQEAQAGTGELKKTFAELGIDAVGKSVDEMLSEFADKIAALPEDQRLRHAFKAFDAEGAALVTVLANGSAGLKAYAEQAHATGSVIEADVVNRLAAADAQLELLGRQLKVVFVDLIDTLLPLFKDLKDGWRIMVDGMMASGVFLLRMGEELMRFNFSGALSAAQKEARSFADDRAAFRQRQAAQENAFAKAGRFPGGSAANSAANDTVAGAAANRFRAPNVDALKRIGGFRGESSNDPVLRQLKNQNGKQDEMISKLEAIRQEVNESNRNQRDLLG